MNANKRHAGKLLGVVGGSALVGAMDVIHTGKVVHILDNYHKVDRIVISRGQAETVISGCWGDIKEAFEPQVILSGYRKA